MSRVSRLAWLMAVSTVSLLQGYQASAEVAIPSCSSVSPSAGAEREWKIGNAIAFSTKVLQVDADGAPDSYRVDGNGLSDTCDGVVAIVNGIRQTRKNNKDHWLEPCRGLWRKATASHDYSQVDIFGFLKDKDGPVIQGVGDPLPGTAYITTTSMVIAGTPERNFRTWSLTSPTG